MSNCTIYLPFREFYISDVLDYVNQIVSSEVFYTILEEESKLKMKVSIPEKIDYLENSLLDFRDEKLIDFFTDRVLNFDYKLDYNNRKITITQSGLVSASDHNIFDFSETEHVSLLGKELFEYGRIFEEYEIVEFEDCDKYIEKYMQLNHTLIEKLCDFIKFEYFVEYLDGLRTNPSTKTSPNIISKKKTSLPYQIALLNELGFFELDRLKNIPQDKVYQIVAKLLNADKRGVSGNHRVLDPNSNEDVKRYTSYNYMEEVKKYLNEL